MMRLPPVAMHTYTRFAYTTCFRTCDFHASSYSQEPPPVEVRDGIIVDFSYKRTVLQEKASIARSVLVLDHHKTAAEDLAGLPAAPENYATWCEQVETGDEPTIAALFDMDSSGAGIAWDFFHDAARPPLVDYVQDRDLWRWALPYSREISAAISSADRTFDDWRQLELDVRNHQPLVIKLGAAILKKHEKDVSE